MLERLAAAAAPAKSPGAQLGREGGVEDENSPPVRYPGNARAAPRLWAPPQVWRPQQPSCDARYPVVLKALAVRCNDSALFWGRSRARKMPGCLVPMQARRSQSGRRQSAEQESEFLRKAAALGIRVSPYYRRPTGQ